MELEEQQMKPDKRRGRSSVARRGVRTGAAGNSSETLWIPDGRAREKRRVGGTRGQATLALHKHLWVCAFPCPNPPTRCTGLTDINWSHRRQIRGAARPALLARRKTLVGPALRLIIIRPWMNGRPFLRPALGILRVIRSLFLIAISHDNRARDGGRRSGAALAAVWPCLLVCFCDYVIGITVFRIIVSFLLLLLFFYFY